MTFLLQFTTYIFRQNLSDCFSDIRVFQQCKQFLFQRLPLFFVQLITSYPPRTEPPL